MIFIEKCSCGSREILIFEGAIFSLWNHRVYCLFRQSVFKTVFVFKIRTILVVRVKKGPVKSRDYEVSEQLRLLWLLPAKPNQGQKICIGKRYIK